MEHEEVDLQGGQPESLPDLASRPIDELGQHPLEFPRNKDKREERDTMSEQIEEVDGITETRMGGLRIEPLPLGSERASFNSDSCHRSSALKDNMNTRTEEKSPTKTSQTEGNYSDSPDTSRPLQRALLTLFMIAFIEIVVLYVNSISFGGRPDSRYRIGPTPDRGYHVTEMAQFTRRVAHEQESIPKSTTIAMVLRPPSKILYLEERHWTAFSDSALSAHVFISTHHTLGSLPTLKMRHLRVTVDIIPHNSKAGLTILLSIFKVGFDQINLAARYSGRLIQV